MLAPVNTPNRLQPADVPGLAHAADGAPPCPHCAVFRCPGWEPYPASASEAHLECRGALWLPGDDEPTLAEHHPAGTNYWSADAPIALLAHPYNRCEVWQCARCRRAFLRYTEYGGYYVDRRIRALDPTLLVDDA